MLILASKSSGRLATLRSAGIDPVVRVSQVDEPSVLAALEQQHLREGSGPPSPAAQVQALARAKARTVAGALMEPSPTSSGPVAVPTSGPTSNPTPNPTSNPAEPELPEPGAGPAAGAHARAPHDPRRRTARPPDLVVGCDSMLEIDGQVVGKPRTPHRARERWLAMRGRSGLLHSGHCVIRTDDGACAEGVSSTVVHFGRPSEEEIDAYVASGEPLWCAGAFTIDGLGGAFIEGVEGDPHGVVGLSLPLLRRLVGELGVSWTDLWRPPPPAGATGAPA